jgi:undecaprenyl-phosphate galactose phosphotransferase/putative colanic acid biosynthesis UDP-glucose lipid carrier transferase
MFKIVDQLELGTRAHRESLGISLDLIKPLFALADASIIVCSSIVGNAAYQAIAQRESDFGLYIGLGLFFCIGYLLAARHFGIYQIHEFVRPRMEYQLIFASWSFVVMLLSLFFFLMKLGSQVSRGSVFCFVVLALLALMLWRTVAKRILKNGLETGGIRGQRTLVVGTRDELSSVASDYLLTRYGIDETERVILPLDKPDQPSTQSTAAEVHTAVNIARTINASEVVVALPWGHTNLVKMMQEQFRILPIRVRLLPDRFARSLMGSRSRGDIHLQLIDIQHAPLSRIDRILKRLLDVVVTAIGLLIISPLMAVVFVAVRLDSTGSVIFRQRRRGFNGREFVMYKFRTMRVTEDGLKITQATKHDPRVTRLGEILRLSSIDELPQLFNVLKGDMSLVGPRPHPLAHDDDYRAQIGDYAFRHHVKPGITGLAQVEGLRGGHGSLELMKKRIELDLWYIDNWSFWLDLKILIRTGIVIFSGRNAY